MYGRSLISQITVVVFGTAWREKRMELIMLKGASKLKYFMYQIYCWYRILSGSRQRVTVTRMIIC